MARKARRHRAGGDRADLEVAERRAAARPATASSTHEQHGRRRPSSPGAGRTARAGWSVSGSVVRAPSNEPGRRCDVSDRPTGHGSATSCRRRPRRPWAAVSSADSLASAGSSATMRPLWSTATRSHISATLPQLTGEHHDSSAVVCQRSDEVVHLVLRIHVDPPGRIEQQHHPQSRRQPASDRHLLLIATRQAAHLARRPRVSIDNRSTASAMRRAFGTPVDRPPPPHPIEQRSSDVLADGALRAAAPATDQRERERHPCRITSNGCLALDGTGRRCESWSTVRPPVAGEDVEQRFLPLTLQSDEPEYLPPTPPRATRRPTDGQRRWCSASSTGPVPDRCRRPLDTIPARTAYVRHGLAERRRHDLSLAAFAEARTTPRHDRHATRCTCRSVRGPLPAGGR